MTLPHLKAVSLHACSQEGPRPSLFDKAHPPSPPPPKPVRFPMTLRTASTLPPAVLGDLSTEQLRSLQLATTSYAVELECSREAVAKAAIAAKHHPPPNKPKLTPSYAFFKPAAPAVAGGSKVGSSVAGSSKPSTPSTTGATRAPSMASRPASSPYTGELDMGESVPGTPPVGEPIGVEDEGMLLEGERGAVEQGGLGDMEEAGGGAAGEGMAEEEVPLAAGVSLGHEGSQEAGQEQQGAEEAAHAGDSLGQGEGQEVSQGQQEAAGEAAGEVMPPAGESLAQAGEHEEAGKGAEDEQGDVLQHAGAPADSMVEEHAGAPADSMVGERAEADDVLMGTAVMADNTEEGGAAEVALADALVEGGEEGLSEEAAGTNVAEEGV